MSKPHEVCNVCGAPGERHTLVTDFERVLGATVWVYDDGYARVVPWHTRDDRLAEVGDE